ncbi:hypothetical protein QVD17_11973 [Tagetes erecta]|uniref:Uncharacterized protein n=1 Tax=Tagetes erecta TaxID=13708 RepID=A0AAD8KUE3_TARER|nr:hypothetical protein QVD17_11973 [Tagetes erecta]
MNDETTAVNVLCVYEWCIFYSSKNLEILTVFMYKTAECGGVKPFCLNVSEQNKKESYWLQTLLKKHQMV